MQYLAYTKENRIQNLSSLCLALKINQDDLLEIANNVQAYYKPPYFIDKKNGGQRCIIDTVDPLKSLLKSINKVFFKNVYFPEYLTGSVSGSDYISNAQIHSGLKNVITEDISSFFDHITAQHVYGIWKNFFKFSDPVSQMLTQLTTKDTKLYHGEIDQEEIKQGRIYQGVPTSSYLANLSLWRNEQWLVNELHKKGFVYSRYVDDMTISSPNVISREDKTWVISHLIGMLSANGLRIKRSKHAVLTNNKQMNIMGLNINGSKPTIPEKERDIIRATLHRFDKHPASFSVEDLRSLQGKIINIRRIHVSKGEKFFKQFKAILRKNHITI
ncbi:reverse transcriptase family protein [Commensalibacter papalotli (ex Botero et al. 2024)]|uniref:Reverse transcriptase domain-containing protein n=1 Tax=Commensalibacter papalotli (ex Botero et al. 2024) TaxID=2972766 RepID=A0ABM9HR34_9PROT|nr:reverse transcriptase family protein [Commensalibacter papalotli (ex Botero et al. 2024)]CAI3943078.1 unnamed protein product [Commensalibacter papalotli (ex Botero et al. 2024)]CAI3947856.1 unnamed protein product [Commensalibacter papalotli (ex Botero et al. 2024)]